MRQFSVTSAFSYLKSWANILHGGIYLEDTFFLNSFSCMLQYDMPAIVVIKITYSSEMS